MRQLALVLLITSIAAFAGCASRTSHLDPSVGGCNHTHKLPPLQLTPDHERLLAAVSPQPKTALDYYMVLPKSYFSIMPDSRERRVTYIDAQTLSDDYLTASQSFECDGGGFGVTLKLYRTPTNTFVVLKQGKTEKIFDDGKPREGEPSVSIERPALWLYSNGTWLRQPDSRVPKISAERVLAKYHRDWDADKQYTDQEKSIWIDYVVGPATSEIVLMGRENFQSGVYEYGRLKWRGTRFSFK